MGKQDCTHVHNCYDNAMVEGSVSILKTECIYRHAPKTFEDAGALLNNCIHFCNHERIQFKSGETPLSRRLSAY